MTKLQRENFYKWVIPLCFAGSGLFLLKLLLVYIPIFHKIGESPDKYLCIPPEIFCGTITCSYSGNIHIAWKLPLFTRHLYIIPGMALHFFLFFIPSLVAGLYTIPIFIFLTGPVLATILTDDDNESPTIWCLFSVVQILMLLCKYRLNK